MNNNLHTKTSLFRFTSKVSFSFPNCTNANEEKAIEKRKTIFILRFSISKHNEMKGKFFCVRFLYYFFHPSIICRNKILCLQDLMMLIQNFMFSEMRMLEKIMRINIIFLFNKIDSVVKRIAHKNICFFSDRSFLFSEFVSKYEVEDKFHYSLIFNAAVLTSPWHFILPESWIELLNQNTINLLFLHVVDKSKLIKKNFNREYSFFKIFHLATLFC